MDTASSDADDIEDLSDGQTEEDFYNSQNVRTEDIPMAVHGNLIQNNKSKMLHKASENDKWKTLCGASVGNSTHLPRGSRFKWPLCSRCFKEGKDASRQTAQVGSMILWSGKTVLSASAVKCLCEIDLIFPCV